MSQGVWAASRGWKRQRNVFSPRASRKDYSPADTFILAQRDPFHTSDFQDCKECKFVLF